MQREEAFPESGKTYKRKIVQEKQERKKNKRTNRKRTGNPLIKANHT